VIRKEAAINEETIIWEKAAVDKSTTNETRTVKLVKSATLKIHITALKTSRTTAMKAPATKASTAKTSVTNTDRRHREKTREYSSKEKLRFHLCSFVAPPFKCEGTASTQSLLYN
jgi:hypothetical protein